MKILIAEDDATSQLLLQSTLEQWDHEVVVTSDGLQAYQALLADDAPRLAIFDWMMPHLDGVDICRKARKEARLEHLYVIILTTRDTKDDIAEALSAGADDYLNKPFDRKELQARIQVGKRVLDLQMTLADRVRELEEAIARKTPPGSVANLFLLQENPRQPGLLAAGRALYRNSHRRRL